MATADKIFISHASTDRKLADLLRDTLVLGGIPRERIFYSSARATGIPSGTDVRAHLRSELQQAGLVKTPADYYRLAVEQLGFATEIMDSPILGAEGNKEFLLHARH